MAVDQIIVRGAREHNLKSVDVDIPRDKLVVITGVSGSGKSSLAFDTVYAEGQRRYVESLSAYARQFLGRLDKPDVDYIEGLSPSISIDQRGVSRNPRSTVGTVTEIYDYLRLLFARVGHPYCPKCLTEVSGQSVQQMVDTIMGFSEGFRFMLLAPLVVRKKGEHRDILQNMREAGFVRVRINGDILELSEDISLERQKWHTIHVVVDRLVASGNIDRVRLTDSVETALRIGAGILTVASPDKEDFLFSESLSCVTCGYSIPEIEPRTFSFNSPHGACDDCSGLGFRLQVDPALVIGDERKSIRGGAITPWNRSGRYAGWHFSILESIGEVYGFDLDTPFDQLSKDVTDLVLYGNRSKKVVVKHRTRRGRVVTWKTAFEGVIENLQRRYIGTKSDYVRREIEQYMARVTCAGCDGNRLKPGSLAVLISGRSVIEVTRLPIVESLAWVRMLGDQGQVMNEHESQVLSHREAAIADQILKEIEGRLQFLVDIGLGYLSMERQASTLSGGEAQRIRLATQIGSGLVGVLYVCDEPTVGLHPADDTRLISTLEKLRDLGNTVLVVEHDEAMMRAADWIIDLGPAAGSQGGEVVAVGEFSRIASAEASLTGAYLSGRKSIPIPTVRREGIGKNIVISGARENNLKNITVRFPLGVMNCVTGVSGSGKSTLVNEIVYKGLMQKIYRSKERPGSFDSIDGVEYIDKVVNIDQSPIGRTPRSNAATYTGAFTPIRELFSAVPEARARGYKPGRFSFNVKGGRCEACGGEGFNQIEMQFLPTVTVVCEICNGRRYNREALEIQFKEKTIADVLAMTVSEALEFFWNFQPIRTRLQTLKDVGLGYMRLGQPATTLSGGEAQRIKLATELSRKATGKTLYILDEPTTGLSFDDCARLLQVLHRLVDAGNTVILIEHNLDMIKNADWIVDLGPGPGMDGGELVAEGSIQAIQSALGSATGQYL